MAENPPKYRLVRPAANEVYPPVAAARLKLLKDLNHCWNEVFPLEVQVHLRPKPTSFFEPFQQYGIALYDASAEAALATPIHYGKYKAWIDHELKQAICEFLAPLRTRRLRGQHPKTQKPSQWQRWLAESWKNFDHPLHAELSARADELINALEDPSDYYYSRFVEVLYKALSRRTPFWLVRAFDAQRSPAESPDKKVSPVTPVRDSEPSPVVRGRRLRAGGAEIEKVKHDIRELKAAGVSQHEICTRLKSRTRPPNAAWRNLTWLAAFRDPVHKPAVKCWISGVK